MPPQDRIQVKDDTIDGQVGHIRKCKASGCVVAVPQLVPPAEGILPVHSASLPIPLSKDHSTQKCLCADMLTAGLPLPDLSNRNSYPQWLSDPAKKSCRSGGSTRSDLHAECQVCWQLTMRACPLCECLQYLIPACVLQSDGLACTLWAKTSIQATMQSLFAVGILSAVPLKARFRQTKGHGQQVGCCQCNIHPSAWAAGVT